MKKVFLVLSLIVGLSSCADEKTFTIDNKQVTVQPYGWANYETKQNDSIIYEPVFGNIVWSIILVETIVAPVYFTGWAVMEPVEKRQYKG